MQRHDWPMLIEPGIEAARLRRKRKTDVATIYKPAGRKKYIIEYFDENGDRRRKTGATDKTVTERLARDLEYRVL